MVLTDLPDPPSMEQVSLTSVSTRSFVDTFSQFTVVIVSFARVDTLIKIVKHLQHSNYVREIIVVWNNLDVGSPRSIEDEY
jgi:hypothetical protein